MKIIRYTPDIDPETNEAIPPVQSAIRLGQSNNWLIQSIDDYDNLPETAVELAPPAVLSVFVARNDLPDTHPLKGERVPQGPFPAGSLPGDPRINADGSWDYYNSKTSQWIPWRDSSGQPILAEIDILDG